VKKILFALLAVVAAIGLMGGAFAYFTDTVVSGDNVFSAGTLNLQMGSGNTAYTDADNVVLIGTNPYMSPGHASEGPYTVYFKNTGTIGGVISAQVNYNTGVTGTAFAKLLIVDKAYSSLLGNSPEYNVAEYWARQIAEQTGNGTWADAVANGYIVADPSAPVYGYYPTIEGLTKIILQFTDGYNGPAVTLAANGGEQWDQMYIKLDSTAGNEFQGFGITIVVTATLTSN
jgi:predicted ribosomally synthesized peptide with SipW-like signal peptide